MKQIIFKLILLSLLVSACSSYSSPTFIIRHPDFYDYKAAHDDLTVVADPYISEGKQVMLFNHDARKKGVYPVHLIFFNEGDKEYGLRSAQARLILEEAQTLRPLSEEETMIVSGRNVAGRAAKFGIIGALLGTIAAPITVIPATLWGGIDTSKSNALGAENINSQKFKGYILEPKGQNHGFVFFKLEGNQVRQRARLELTGIEMTGGQQVNFSILLPPLSGES